MSDYGADKKPDLNVAAQLAYNFGLCPQDKSNVMQWSYPGGYRVQKLACRKDHTNVHIKLDY